MCSYGTEGLVEQEKKELFVKLIEIIIYLFAFFPFLFSWWKVGRGGRVGLFTTTNNCCVAANNPIGPESICSLGPSPFFFFSLFFFRFFQFCIYFKSIFIC